MKDLNYVVITGVSKGLGKALAEQFIRRNIKVVGGARTAPESQLLKDNLSFSAVDVTNSDAVKSWAHSVIQEHGVPDLVIQCAGTVNKPEQIESLPAGAFKHVFDVNLMGVVHGLQSFLPAMKRQDKGVIVSISSGWGKSGKEGLAPYCASKFAVEGLIDSVSRELTNEVKVYALDPGDGIQTDMLSTCLPDYYPDAPSADEWAKCAYDSLRLILASPPEQVSLTVDLSSLTRET